MTALGDNEDPPPNEIPTAPDASVRPFPRHDSLPTELVGEAKTDRPPATLDEIRDLMLELLGNQEALRADQATLARNVFLKLGEHDEILGSIQAANEAVAVHQDKRLTEAIVAARNAANGALEAAAQVGQLRDAIGEQSTLDKSRLATAELLIDGTNERIEGITSRIERLEASAGE